MNEQQRKTIFHFYGKMPVSTLEHFRVRNFEWIYRESNGNTLVSKLELDFGGIGWCSHVPQPDGLKTIKGPDQGCEDWGDSKARLVEVIEVLRKRDREHIEFVIAMDTMMEDIHQTAIEHGWWDTPTTDGEQIAMMHCELSEAMEAVRSGNPEDPHLPAMPAMVVELADCIIRILDFCEHRNLPIVEAIYEKAQYNKYRPYKHGGKLL